MNECRFILSCDSAADLTEEHLKRRGISYIGYPYELDGEQYLDDLGVTIPLNQFYAAMENGASTRTAQINYTSLESYFEPFLADGKDILHLCLSSGITGVMNSARIAKEVLEEKYPARKILLVDSLAASSGFGLLMDQLADLRDAGMGMEELAQWTEENKLRVHHWFFSTDLSFYIKGGRVSRTAGTIGNLLGICPLLNVSVDGKLILREKVRSKKRVIKTIVEKMEDNADGGAHYAGKCFISHSACLEDAQAVARLATERFPNLYGEPTIFDIGTTIGSHSGPGTVALFFWGRARND